MYVFHHVFNLYVAFCDVEIQSYLRPTLYCIIGELHDVFLASWHFAIQRAAHTTNNRSESTKGTT